MMITGSIALGCDSYIKYSLPVVITSLQPFNCESSLDTRLKKFQSLIN